jgi:hypothetical protein
MVTTGYPNWCYSWLQQGISTGVFVKVQHDILTGGCHGYSNISQLMVVMVTTGYPN